MTRFTDKQDVTLEILRVIRELQNGSGFGSVEIILHEGRITQIEKREKLRFITNKTDTQKQDTSTTSTL